MRIGIDTRLINETGVGRYIQSIVPFIVKNKKVQWFLIVRKSERELLDLTLKNIQKSNITIIEFNERWHSIKEQIFLPLVLNKLKLNLFHSPYINVPLFYFKPLAVTIHDLTFLTHKTGKASANKFLYYFLQIGYKIVLKKALACDIIFTVSSSVKKEIVETFAKIDPSKIKVTPNGFVKIAQEKEYNPYLADLVKQSSPYFFYMGNAQPHKNLDFLVENLDIFFNKVKKYKIIIAGRDDYFMQKLFEKCQKMKNSQNFVFLKNPKDEDLYSLYSKSEALILPSLKEGFGLQILEAMQTNTLILASGIDSYKEIGSTSLMYFNPTSSKSFFLALARILKFGNKDKKQIFNKYKSILTRYNFKITAGETLNSYFLFLNKNTTNKKNIKNLIIQNYLEKPKK
ncbi:glycosyltransferase family 4 protein [Patescibacteria group bacterium]|nr:glycosyltransferase family 4 protein [Patescibacteria group bacterium]